MSTFTAASTTSNTSMYSALGASSAKFLNQYNPMHDKPYERLTMNRGQYLNADLEKLLVEDRASSEMHRFHRRRDEVKAYMDECVKYQAVTKGGKK